ncbi:phosphatase PAP2 family protein [Actinobacillus indolicus]|uniref:Phosphatase PAP2 family protein n=1 Tax=Actinobacillus indolicus TaxID=51049 RepID=A0A4P7CI02_9PAST|nr:phosphatase PAP2/dual specificity phosphatase family protein [Actinobacillus indolicus]QBQ63725.1 phosphatase PAP2 family protein [Actinobacillus indolicus]
MMKHLRHRLGYLLAVGMLFYASYGLSNWFTAQRADVPEIAYEWEQHIPFLAWTIVPYWSLNVMYSLAFFFARSRQELHRYITHLVVAQVIAVSCFLLFPLQFSWTKPETTGISGYLFASLATFDQPYNQAPSLHIILTVIVGMFYWRYLPRTWRIPLLLWLGLIAVSILTTYQHHFIDLPTGALVGWLVVWALPYEQPSPLQKWRRFDASRFAQMKWYLLGGIAVSVIAVVLGGSGFWLLWISVALFLVSYALYYGGIRVYQKQPNGKLSTAATVLLLPYLIGVRTNIAFWLRGKPKSSQVQTNLAIGSLTVAKQFDAVVDLCAEYPCIKPPANYVSVPMLDMATPTVDDLITAVYQVQQFHRQQYNVLVCCALGYGRSAAVILVWLVVYGGCQHLPQALERLRSIRPHVVLPLATEQVVLATIEYLQKNEEN